jgi:hypothetical protein
MLAMLAAWTLILAALVPASASASVAEESSFIAQVNATRTARGLQPLQLDIQLTNLARGWAGSMRDGVCGAGSFICHASPISAGVTHPWVKLGENVGTGPDVGSIMKAFIASPGHYANIVDPEFTHIGVGVVWDGNRMFTTHRFMKLQSSAPATTAAPTPTTTTSPPTTAVAPTTTSAAPTTAAPLSAPTTAAPTTAAPLSAPTPQGGDLQAAQPTSVLEQRVVTVLGALAKVTS